MSASFCPQHISFRINGLTVKLDNLNIHNNPNKKWLRFCGTPCNFWKLETIYFLAMQLTLIDGMLWCHKKVWIWPTCSPVGPGLFLWFCKWISLSRSCTLGLLALLVPHLSLTNHSFSTIFSNFSDFLQHFVCSDFVSPPYLGCCLFLAPLSKCNILAPGQCLVCSKQGVTRMSYSSHIQLSKIWKKCCSVVMTCIKWERWDHLF